MFGMIGVALFAAATVVGGLQFEHYSHVSQFISETYGTGAPWGHDLRLFGFIPSGMALLLFALLALSVLPRSTGATVGLVGLGVFYGLGTVVCSIFICDQGCGRNGEMVTASQVVHNIMGFLTYLIVPPCLVLIGLAARAWPDGLVVSRAGLLCGALAFLLFMLFVADPGSSFVGLIQRVLEGAVLLWVLLCSLHLFRIGRKQHFV